MKSLMINKKRSLPISLANKNSVVLENTSLFLDLDQTVHQLAEFISHFENSDILVTVLCQDAMPVANRIARKLELTLIFSDVGLNAKTAESGKGIPVHFDYGIVKESGRDIPQNFIVHQEQNLRTNLICLYMETYEALTKTYPDKLVILVDQLTNIDTAFFPCLTHNYPDQSGGNSFSIPAIRKFVFLHSANGKSESSIKQSFDIIIEHTFIETA